MAIDWSSETAADLVVLSLAEGIMKINISGGRSFILKSFTVGMKPGRWYLNTLQEATTGGQRKYWFVEASYQGPKPFSAIKVPWLRQIPPDMLRFHIISSRDSIEETPLGYDWFNNNVEVGDAQETVLTFFRRVVGPPMHGGGPYPINLNTGPIDPGKSWAFNRYDFPPKFVLVRG